MSIVINDCQISIHYREHGAKFSRLHQHTKVGILPNLLLRELGADLAKIAFTYVLPFIAKHLKIQVEGFIDCTVGYGDMNLIVCPQHTYMVYEHYNHEIYVQFNANIDHNTPRGIDFNCTPKIIERCAIG